MPCIGACSASDLMSSEPVEHQLGLLIFNLLQSIPSMADKFFGHCFGLVTGRAQSLNGGKHQIGSRACGTGRLPCVGVMFCRADPVFRKNEIWFGIMLVFILLNCWGG